MASIIQIRRDTASAWTAADPILAQGELGLETDTSKLKAGDGISSWTILPYYDLGTVGYVSSDDIGVAGGVQAFDGNIVTSSDIGTSVQGYDADTSKTDVAETRSASIDMSNNLLQRPELKSYTESVAAMVSFDVDLALGNVHTKTITQAEAITFSNAPAAGISSSFTLILTNGGSNVVTWPMGVFWPLGTAPTLSLSGQDILVFTTIDAGVTWYGVGAWIGG